MNASVSRPPLELVFRGKDEVVAYACPQCGTVVSPAPFGEDDLGHAAARKLAEEHCETRCRCGAERSKSRIFCDACWKKDQFARDLQKLQYAEQLGETEYGNFPVYWEGRESAMGDGYFSTIDEVKDYCAESGESLPPYIWACTPVELKISVEQILDAVFQEHNASARDMLEEGSEEELETLLNEWCRKQEIRSWQVDYRRAILLGSEGDGDVEYGSKGPTD